MVDSTSSPSPALHLACIREHAWSLTLEGSFLGLLVVVGLLSLLRELNASFAIFPKYFQNEKPVQYCSHQDQRLLHKQILAVLMCSMWTTQWIPAK